MLRTFMNAKIHRATITDSNLDYVGSITISPELLDAAGIGVHELVAVVDVNNGSRFETYTILGASGAAEVVVNGAAARLVATGDKIIVISYAQFTEEELAGHKSRVVHVDGRNQIIETVLQAHQ